MPIIDPFTLPRKADKTDTRTFTENEIELTLTLAARNDYTRRLLCDEKAALYAARYVTGEMVRGDDGKMQSEVSTVRPVGGMIPAVGTWLCTLIARLEMMQVTEGMEQPLTFDQWAAYGVLMPQTLAQIADWSYELLHPDAETPADDPVKNDSGAAAAP